MDNGFPDRLRRLREKRGLNRKELSELCGLEPGSIRKYERGESIPRSDSLHKIADFFGVSMDELWKKNF